MLAVTVVADPGIGKSRLLHEFEDWTGARPEAFSVFRGRATQETSSQAFGLLRNIVARHLHISVDDSVEAARKKMEDGIAPLFLQDDGPTMAEGHAHLLGYLIGIEWGESRHIKGIRDDPKQIRSRGFHAAAQMFQRVMARVGAPGILLLEDLHWADGESLDFLRFLATVNRDVPMLVLAFTRPTLFERRADWVSTDGFNSRIDLKPLDDTHSVALANELLKKLPQVPSALRQLLTASAEGNPFYMEELTKMLIDQGALRTGDVWSVDAQRLQVTSVPLTLTSVLQARLDSLPGRERRALQQASIIGAVFWDQALVAVDAQAAERLAALVQRELTLPRTGTELHGMREYAFHHQLLHQVTYDTVLKQQRREGHARVGRWLAALAEHGSLRAGDCLGRAAQHFERAGDGPTACEYYARAATHAAGRYAHDAVLRYVGRAIELMGVDASPDARLMRWRLLDVRERTLDLQGRRLEQRTDVEALEALADALDDDSRRAEAAWRRCDMALRTANFPAMESAARRAQALAERVGAVALQLRAQQRLAVALFMLGDAAAGRAMAESTLAAARALGLRSVEALALNALAAIANEQEDWMDGLDKFQQKLQVERDLGNARSTSTTLVNMGALWLELGQNAQARGHLEEGLQLVRAVGDRATECYPLLSLAVLALREGDAASALAHAQSALDIAVAMHDPLIEANALCRLGDAEVLLGRLDAAEAAFLRAHTTASTLKHARQYDAAAGLARVALARGDPPRYLAPVQGLIDHLAADGTLQGTDSRRIRLTCYRWLAHVGDPRAVEALADAHAELQAVAAAITDAAVRDGFMENIEEHRQIVAAFDAC